MEIVLSGWQVLAIYSLYLVYTVVFCGFMYYGLFQLSKCRTDRVPVFMAYRALGLKQGVVHHFIVLHAATMAYAAFSTCLMIKFTGSDIYLFYHVSLLIASIVSEALFVTSFLTLHHEQTKK